MLKLGKLTLAGVIGSVALSTTAQAACWTPAEADAAMVRDLQSRMMVATLRCMKSNDNLLSQYNKFVRGKRPILKLSNDVLKGHFAKGKSKRQALKSYDRYAVSLANSYGAGSGDLSECKAMKKLATTAANSDSRMTSLVSIAKEQGLAPILPGGRCKIVLASNTK